MMSGQLGLVQNAQPSEIIKPKGKQVRIFRDDVGGLYYAKLPDGTVELINGPGVTGDWHIVGNAGTNPAINFIGTTDDVDFLIKRNSIESIRIANGGDTKIGFFNPAPTFNIHGVGQTQFKSNLGVVGLNAFIDVNTSNGVSGISGAGISYEKNAFSIQGFISLDTISDELRMFHDNTVSGYMYAHTYSSAIGNLLTYVKDTSGSGLESQIWAIPSELRLVQSDGVVGLDSRITINSAGVETKVFSALGPITTTFTVNSSGFSVSAGAIGTMTFDSTGSIVINGGIMTGDPGFGATPWKLGTVVAAASVLDATKYVEVEISGVVRKLALIV